jgi:hypothetical protein
MKADLLRRLAGRQQKDAAAEAERLGALKRAETKVRLRIKEGDAAKENNNYDDIPHKISMLQGGIDELAALNPPSGTSYADALERGRAAIADLRAFLWEKQQQNARAAEEAAAAAAAAQAARPAGPPPIPADAPAGAAQLDNDMRDTGPLGPDFKLDVEQKWGGGGVRFKNAAIPAIRKKFGLGINNTEALKEQMIYNEKDFINKLNQQISWICTKKNKNRRINLPSFLLWEKLQFDPADPKRFNVKINTTERSIVLKDERNPLVKVIPQAGGGSRSNRKRATRATRKRRHN